MNQPLRDSDEADEDVDVDDQTNRNLWLLIFLGLAFRFIAAIYWSPLESHATDSLRHIYEAMHPESTGPIHILDPPIYPLWLRMWLEPFQSTPVAVYLYAGMMSVLMPLSWYPWLCMRFSEERYRLCALAVLTLFPSFIAIYSFFQPETLALPLMGLALWSSELVRRKPGLWLAAFSGILWGLAFTTKITLVVFALVALVWCLYSIYTKIPRSKLVSLAVMSIVAASAVYSTVPIKIYRGLHILEFAPGMYHFNKMLYESGDIAMIITGTYYPDGKVGFGFNSPSIFKSRMKPYEPFREFQTTRRPCRTFEVDMSKQPYALSFPVSFTDRICWTLENFFFFFFASSWPEDNRGGWLFDLEVFLCWLWLPLTLITGAWAVKYKVRTLPVLLFFVAGAVLLFQQSSIMEGRFRKPWECIALIAFLDVWRSRENMRNQVSEKMREPVSDGSPEVPILD